MNGMDEEELKQALDHDAAIKGANGGIDVVADDAQADETTQSPVPAALLLDGLELKNAALAKSVTMSYTNVAQQCAGLILDALNPGVVVDGKDPPSLDQRIAQVELLMNVAKQALHLADEADVLGDKAVVRAPELADPVATE